MTPSLPPHRQRVLDERAALDDKLAKLHAFIITETFRGLPHDERLRLRRQRLYMQLYRDVLAERIEAFTPKEAA